MNKTIYMIDNGIFKEVKRETYISKKPYLTQNENCFKNIIKQENIENENKNTIIKLKEIISTMIKEIKNNNKMDIQNIYNEIIKSKNKKDLLNIINSFINIYDYAFFKKTYNINKENINKTFIKNFINNNDDLVISIFIKKIIFTYYTYTLLKIDPFIINLLEKRKLNNEKASSLMQHLALDINSDNKELKILCEKIFLDSIDLVFDNIQNHLCFLDCENASPLKCEKFKKSINCKLDEFDFITDGYQTFNKNGELDRCIITGCNNYKKETQKKFTLEEQTRMNEIKKSLKIFYFDAVDLDEATEIEETNKRYLIKRYY